MSQILHDALFLSFTCMVPWQYVTIFFSVGINSDVQPVVTNHAVLKTLGDEFVMKALLFQETV